MNIFCFWHYSTKKDGLKLLLRRLDATYCAYDYYREGGLEEIDEIKNEGIFFDETPEYYDIMSHDCLPLDKDIIEKMKEYMPEELELIFRWRSSLETGNSYNKIRDLYYVLMKYWNDFIIKRNIDLMIILDTPHSAHEYMIYSLCRCYKIPIVIGAMLSYIEGKQPNMYFKTAINQIYPEFEEKYNKTKEKYLSASFEEIPLRESLKEYFTSYGGGTKGIKTVVVSERQKSLLFIAIERGTIYLRQRRYKTLLKKIYKFITMKHKTKKVLRHLEKIEKEISINEEYVFFPLHLQPEASTCPNSGVYANQELVVQIVANALPKGVSLYIKEHPAYWIHTAARNDEISDSRSKKFYDTINNLENVKFIKHTISSSELVDKAKAVVTVNGTAGWEAVFRKKPVIMFGHSFYENMEGIFKASNVLECKNAFRIIFSDDYVPIRDKDIAIYLKAFEDIVVNASNDYDVIKNNCCSCISKDENARAITDGLVFFIKRVYPHLLK